MASGIYSQSVNMSRALMGDPIVAAAETDRLVLQSAVMRKMTCQATGAILDTASAVLATVLGVGGEEGRNVAIIVTGAAFDENGGEEHIAATTAEVKGTGYEIIDGRHYTKSGSLTAAELRRRQDAATSVR